MTPKVTPSAAAAASMVRKAWGRAHGQENPDAAWYYPEPNEAAAEIRDHVAFYKGVEVTA